jgi:beta-N-acetylhexosaminidase
MAGLIAVLALAIGTLNAAQPGTPSQPASAATPATAAAQDAQAAQAAQAAQSPASQSQIQVPASTAKLLGQRVMVGVSGTAADATLLRRIRQGRVGSVILFTANIVSRSQLRTLTGDLQRAAREGGNPPLLISIDQEGGQVKRLSNGPPFNSPPQMAASGSTGLAAREGRSTGQYLKGLGINWDLAPVVDVPTFRGAFVWTQGRAFSFDAGTVAAFATAFAVGLESRGVAATGKHFPGVGSAAVDTDNKLDVLRPTPAQANAALVPYRKLISRGVDSIMLSTAAFPRYDASATPTALSRPIVQGLLRGKLGFPGVTITDALGTPTGHDQVTAGVLAARAGADVLLYTDDAAGVLGALQTALGDGRLDRSEAAAAYRRIVDLKRRVAS